MAPSPSQRLALNAYVRHMIEQWASQGQSFAMIAKKLNVSPPHVNNLQKSKAGAGTKTEIALAKLLFNGSRDKLDAAARAFAQTDEGKGFVTAREHTNDVMSDAPATLRQALGLRPYSPDAELLARTLARVLEHEATSSDWTDFLNATEIACKTIRRFSMLARSEPPKSTHSSGTAIRAASLAPDAPSPSSRLRRSRPPRAQ